jgi:hypothetical protein
MYLLHVPVVRYLNEYPYEHRYEYEYLYPGTEPPEGPDPRLGFPSYFADDRQDAKQTLCLKIFQTTSKRMSIFM